MDEKEYTVNEVARLVGVAPPAIRSAIRNKKLRASRFGTSYTITRDALEEYLEYRERRDNGEK